MQREDRRADVVGFTSELLCHGVGYCERCGGCPAAKKGFVILRYCDKRVISTLGSS